MRSASESFLSMAITTNSMALLRCKGSRHQATDCRADLELAGEDRCDRGRNGKFDPSAMSTFDQRWRRVYSFRQRATGCRQLGNCRAAAEDPSKGEIARSRTGRRK